MSRIYIFLKLCFLGLISIGCSSDISGEEVRIPPFEVPFYSDKVGLVYTFDVNIIKQLNYSVNIRYYIITPNKWSYLLDKEPKPQERQNLSEILGFSENLVSGEWIDFGVPAKFRVQILQKINNSIVVDKIVNRPKTNSFFYGRIADLVTQKLPEGLYTIRIEYLEGVPELTPLHATFSIGKAHHGK